MKNTSDQMDRAWAARREGRYQEAYDRMVSVVDALRRAGADAELVTALGRMAHLEMDKGNLKDAALAFEEAISICVRVEDVLGLAHKMRHLGDVHRHAGRSDDARQCYHEALSLYRSQASVPPLDLANAVRMVALDASERGLDAEARERWLEVRELYGGIGLKEGVDEATKYLRDLSQE